ncbi:MAG: heat-shock protein [Phenylobacterium zucineum]|nr:MAG: heat-shock protein [Phenylobacterium zucineum]
MRATYDLSPLYRTLIGADHMAGLMESARQTAAPRDCPPYDVEKIADDGYRITLAVAGFRTEELEILAEPNLLVVRGRRSRPVQAGAYLHEGLSMGPFEQRFDLADHVVVKDARHAEGLLTIDLAREVPEALQRRRIAINTPQSGPLAGLLERKRRAAA